MTSPSPPNNDAALPETFLLRRASADDRLGGWIVSASLLFGGLFSFSFVARGWLGTPWLTLLPLAIAALLASIPAVRRAVEHGIPPVNEAARKWPGRTFCIVVVASAALLLGIALAQGRSLEMLWHDEFSYLVQTRIVQAGRLWMPPHPRGDFFDTFHFVQRPVYGAMYPPGTAIVFAPLLALGLPAWAASLLITSVGLGLLYAVIARLVDPVGGLLGAFMAVALHPVRLVSLMLLSQPVILLLGLLAVWAMLHWVDQVRQGRTRPAGFWMAALGIAVGMAALTRPLDAVCIALPILGLVVWELVKGLRRRMISPKFAAATLGIGLAATAPYLAVQFWMNQRTTGDPLKSLYIVYHEQHYPELLPGFHPYTPGPPRFDLPQKQQFFEGYTQPFLLEHTPEQAFRDWFDPAEGRRAAGFFRPMTPGELVAALLPVGLLFLRDGRRLAIVAAAVLFCAGYSFYAVYMRHYAVAVVAAVVLLIVSAVREGPMVLAAGRGRRWTQTFGLLLVGVACVLQWPPIHPLEDVGFDPQEMIRLREGIEQIERQSLAADEEAIVLFKFDVGSGSAHLEPVYNISTAWPDDARVIRAHDLGEHNMELYRYYARRDPDRVVYTYDRGGHVIQRLGTVRELVDAAGTRQTARRRTSRRRGRKIACLVDHSVVPLFRLERHV